MPTLGPIAGPKQKEESLLIGKMHPFPELIATNEEFYSTHSVSH